MRIKTAMTFMPCRPAQSASGDSLGADFGVVGGEDSGDVGSDMGAVGGWGPRNLSSRMAAPDLSHA